MLKMSTYPTSVHLGLLEGLRPCLLKSALVSGTLHWFARVFNICQVNWR